VLSGQPYLERTDTLGIRDVKLEEGKEAYRPLLELFLQSIASKALGWNLRQELSKILQGTQTPYDVTVPVLTVQSVKAESNALTVLLDFVLEAR
jgi:hypothetical protein